MDLYYYRTERLWRSVPRDKREPQAGPASGQSDSASIGRNASGDDVNVSEPNTAQPGIGEGEVGLPGSKSVARAEGDTRNRGGPKHSGRSNCESQAGTMTQRQGVSSGGSGVGSAHSRSPQGRGPEATEGADRSMWPAQATRTVRMTEKDWQTFLRALAEKAYGEIGGLASRN